MIFETTDNRLTGISHQSKARFLMEPGMSVLCQLATMRTRTCRVDVVLLLFAVSIACFAQSAPTPQQAFAQASPSNPDFAAAQALLQQGKYDEAIALLEKVQGWYPRANVDADYILGLC